MLPPKDDPILLRCKSALSAMYGDRLDRAVLFGSRARGAAVAQSDYDIAVFLTSEPDQRQERKRLANLRVDLLDDMGAFVEARVFASTAWNDRTPLMHEIRRDGVAF